MIVLLSSVTTAGRMKRYLEKKEVRARVMQAPKSLSRSGCAYALWMKEEEKKAAEAAARALHVEVRGYFREGRAGEAAQYVRLE